jgi:glucose/arabinose dehydrogenase
MFRLWTYRFLIRSLFLLFYLVLPFLTVCAVKAQTVPPGFSVRLFANNLGLATAMAFAPDGRLFVSHQNGAVWIVKDGVRLTDPFLTLLASAQGERGLLGVALDPNFPTDPYVYVYYTTRESQPRNRVSRFTANGDVAVPGSEFVLINLPLLWDGFYHHGGGIHFGLDGKLYVGTGDNQIGEFAQSLDDLHGKMLRLNKDGTIPVDNPFYNVATGDNRAIWALGLRNPFTFAIHPQTGRMFINDVGESSWEEINEGMPGANYGWPNTEGYFDPAEFPNFTNPVHVYANDPDNATVCAIAGGTFYPSTAQHFPDVYSDKYFFADLCGGWVRYVDPDSPATSFEFASGFTYPVDLKVGPDGALYVLQHDYNSADSKVYRIAYATAVSGRITLQDCPTVTEPITLTFRPTTGTAFTRTPRAAPNGDFTVYGIPPNAYQVAIKANKFLQKVIAVNTTGGDVAGITATLLGGDANNNNMVEVLDLDILIQAFDGCQGDAGYDSRADFNCDNCVDVLDLDILIRHFDQEGDP